MGDPTHPAADSTFTSPPSLASLSFLSTTLLLQCPMSSLPNHIIDRHLTPPLSPSTSLNSSAASSTSSSQRSSLNHLSATRPDPQHLELCDPAEKLCFMAKRLEEDVVMLEDWEPEDEVQMNGLHGKRIST